VFIALQSVFFSCKYRKTPVFTGKKSFIALGSDDMKKMQNFSKNSPKSHQVKKRPKYLQNISILKPKTYTSNHF
jgi:hypothetical protein